MERFSSEDISGPKKSSGTYISNGCGFALILIAMLTAAVVGLVVNFAVTKEITVHCAPPPESKAPAGAIVDQCVSDCRTAQQTKSVITSSPPTTAAPAKPGKPDMRLPKSIVPIQYFVDLRPDIYKAKKEDFEFSGTVTIRIKCLESTSAIVLHKNKITITNYTLQSGDIKEPSPTIVNSSFDEVTQFLKFNTNAPLVKSKEYILTISFWSSLQPDLSGLYYSSYVDQNGNTRYLATSQMEPTDARKAFPCFDEPAMKAVFTVSLSRKAPMVALSNMPIRTTTQTSDGWFVDRYEDTLPMSTYLLAFIVCDFKYVEAKTKGNTTVRVWAREETLNQTGYALQAGTKITEYFEEFFGEKFPLPKQDMIAIPDFAAGAMENWGLITYRETALLYEPKFASANNLQRVAVVVSHELAHQWFGDLVSPEWWDDLWLNEGFASYVEYLGVDHVEPTWEMMTQILLEDVFSVKYEDSLSTSHPIYNPVNDPDEINELFDSISYAKGATVIRQIRFIIGDEVFQQGLKNYLTQRKFSNANKGHLWQAWDEEAKRRSLTIDVPAIMNTWTDQMGYPLITVSRVNGQTFKVTQQHFLLDSSKPADPRFPSKYGYQWFVPLTVVTDRSPNFNVTRSHITMMTSQESQKNMQIDFDKWFIFNAGSYGYYRVQYEDSIWDSLVNQLFKDYKVIHESNRAQLLDDAFNLVKAGYLNIEKALDVTRYLPSETQFVPLSVGLSHLSEIDRLMDGSAEYGLYEAYMKRILEKLYAESGGFNDTGSSHINQLKKILIIPRACHYDIGDCRAKAKAAFTSWMMNGEAISTNLRSTAYCYGVRLGTTKEWEYVFQMFRNQTSVPTEAIKLLDAMSCTREPWLLSRMLSYALDSDKIRRQDAVSAIVYVSRNPLGKYLAWKFVRANWDLMFQQYGGGSFSFSNLVSGVLRNFNTQVELDEVNAFGEKIAGKLGSASRAFSQAKERIQNNMQFLSKNAGLIVQWLKKSA